MVAKYKELEAKYNEFVKDTTLAIRCSSRFKKDFYTWCRRHNTTPTEVMRVHILKLMSRK